MLTATPNNIFDQPGDFVFWTPPIVTWFDVTELNKSLSNNFDMYVCGFNVNTKQYIPTYNSNTLIDIGFPVIFNANALKENKIYHLFDTIFPFAHWNLWTFLSFSCDLRLGIIEKPLIDVDFLKVIDKNPLHTQFVFQCMRGSGLSSLNNIETFKEVKFANIENPNPVMQRCLSFINIEHDKNTERIIECGPLSIVTNMEFKYNFDRALIKDCPPNIFNRLTNCNNLEFFDIIKRLG